MDKNSDNKSHTIAILIGNSVFNDASLLPLAGITANIESLASCFIDPNLVGISKSNVFVFHNATRKEILERINDINKRADVDSIIIYYSGHGIVDIRGELFLATHDTTSKDFQVTSLSTSDLFNSIHRSKARSKIFILDCSFSGRSLDIIQNSELNKQVGDYFILASSSPNELSVENNFTQGLISVIKNGVDNNNESISIDEIYSNLLFNAKNNGLPPPQYYSNSTSKFPIAKNTQYQHTKSISNRQVGRDDEQHSQNVFLENRLHSDSYNVNDEDILGYDLHAFNLFNIMRDKQTNPPINIGILAPWGRGKTTLMRKIEYLFIQERNKNLELNTSTSTTSIANFKKWLNGKDILPETKISFPTVWFNPWNYQSSEMIWAGMANAVIEQVVSQLPTQIEKESFWFKLRLSRIDKEELRRELQIRAGLFILQFIIWGITILVSIILFFINKTSSISFFGIGALLGAISSVASYLKPNKKDVLEIFDKYTKAPQYLNKLGTFHEVQNDLKRVFDLLITESEPLVIFVDDLDRCSPSKIVEVVEAINVFISGEYCRKTYFVLGMDAEIISASLDIAYEKMKGKVISRETEQGSLGWYFLDKFIQLPFFIPVMSNEKKSEYLESLFKTEGKKRSQSFHGEKQSKLNSGEAQDIARKIMKIQSIDESQKIMDALNLTDGKNVEMEILKQQTDDNDYAEDIKTEVSKYSIYINADPRSIKRFANLLRFYNGYQVLRMKKGQSFVTIDNLGKYIILMLKFPQLIRWIQWDSIDKNRGLTSAITKASLVDKAIAELKLYSEDVGLKLWVDSQYFNETETNVSDNLKEIIKMQSEMPWLKSQNLMKILLDSKEGTNNICYALQCNIW